jgi:hypothetical protein
MEERSIKMEQMGCELAAVAFEEWTDKEDKVMY